MRKYLQVRLYELSYYVEILISIILLVSLLILTGHLALMLTGFSQLRVVWTPTCRIFSIRR